MHEQKITEEATLLDYHLLFIKNKYLIAVKHTSRDYRKPPFVNNTGAFYLSGVTTMNQNKQNSVHPGYPVKCFLQKPSKRFSV